MNKNGYLSREDWQLSVNNLAKALPDRQAEIAKLRAITIEYADSMGITGVKVDKVKFREIAAALSLAEIGRRDRGEMTMAEKVGNAAFDLLGHNHDRSISLDEYKIGMAASGFDEGVAKVTFNFLDKKKSGEIDRKEYSAANAKFWCTLDDPDTQGMYGDKFE